MALDQSLASVRDLVAAAFREADDYHGLLHAQAVEEGARAILGRLHVEVLPVEVLAVQVAALLHDVGYAARQPHWSPDNREHVCASLNFAVANLPTVPVFAEDPYLAKVVGYLIAHHDDTNYKFPSRAWDGRVVPVMLGRHAESLRDFENGLSKEQKDRVNLLLSILREADALTATGESGAHRTMNYSLGRGLPLFNQNTPGNPINAWCWEESAAGNVRIAAKRALIDAFTPEGLRVANDSYETMEQVVRQVCAEHNVAYSPEVAMGTEVSKDSNNVPGDVDCVLGTCVQRYHVSLELARLLRSVPLLGDSSLHPYSDAQIALRRLSPDDLRPTALYVLGTQLSSLLEVETELRQAYELSLFDLTGLVEYERAGKATRMAPPIVERYYEPAEQSEVMAIVDGLHRIALARQLGIDAMWVVEISHVPEDLPIIAMPVTWKGVHIVDVVPPPDEKRRYRFRSPRELDRHLNGIQHAPVTDENYRYYLFRDLSALGSSGMRVPAQ